MQNLRSCAERDVYWSKFRSEKIYSHRGQKDLQFGRHFKEPELEMFDKLKNVAGDAINSGKEKLAAEAERTVSEFLAELSALQPFLAKANVKLGGYRLVIAVPPRFEILNDPDMNWDFDFDESVFDGITLSIYQQAIISALRQVSKFSQVIKSKGFDIAKVDFDISVPPSITIEITTREVNLSLT